MPSPHILTPLPSPPPAGATQRGAPVQEEATQAEPHVSGPPQAGRGEAGGGGDARRDRT